jgi:hypothetical protein
MKKFIDLAVEVIDSLKNGKFVEGSLHKDKQTGKIVFRAYVRQSRNRHERLICPLENGWLKESPKRIKFYTSVKKALGFRLVNVAMHRDLNDAMGRLEVEELLKG